MASKKIKSSEPAGFLKTYLFFYNFIQLIGWSYISFLVLNYYLTGQYNKIKLWNYVFIPVAVFQSAAVLEIVHVILGFVKTSVTVTALQILFRLMNTFGVFNLIPVDVETIGVVLTLIAWCGAEVTRYAFHVFKEINFTPYIVTWIRYSAFIVLIPIGITGELLGQYIIQSLYVNKWNFKLPSVNITVGYRHLIIIIMLSTLQGVIVMYKHMFQQRKKALGGVSARTKSK